MRESVIDHLMTIDRVYRTSVGSGEPVAEPIWSKVAGFCVKPMGLLERIAFIN